MTDAKDDIAERLKKVRGEIHDALGEAGRTPDSASLIAVSKQKPASAIRAAAAAGQVDFGENYLQEAIDKIRELEDLSLQWHFIGPIQSNKTRPIAEHFDWVHTIDRVRVAQRLNDQRPANRGPLQVLLQVNLQREETKSGIQPELLITLAETVAKMPALRLRGLMAIPQPEPNVDLQIAVFERLAQLRDTVNEELVDAKLSTKPMDVLSMGMTDDMRAAILAGSTHVRIGTAIFGARTS